MDRPDRHYEALESRLRRLSLPVPPAEVRRQCLEELLRYMRGRKNDVFDYSSLDDAVRRPHRPAGR